MDTRRITVRQVLQVIILSLLLGAEAWGQTPRGFEGAVAAFQKEDYPEAERQLKLALERDPSSAFGLNLLGVALDRQQKYAEAEEAFQRALRLGRNSALLNNAANHYLATHQRPKARQYFEEALQLSPHHSNALYQLASMDVEERRPRPALARINLLPPNEQGQPAVLLLKERALLQLGENSAARKVVAPLEAVLDQDAATAFSLGVAYYQEKLYADAVRAFEAALRQTPGNFDVLYNLGLAYAREGQKPRATEVLASALRMNPQSADALYQLAAVLSEQGKDEGATELLVRAREIAPDRADIPLLLAHLCLKQRFWSDAAEVYENYLSLRPEDWDARRELAFLYGQSKDYEKGLTHIRRNIAARPQDAQGFYLRGLLSWRQKRAEDATQDFQQAIRLDPRLAEAWSRLGDIVHEQNRLDEAERCFREALRIQPGEANALYGLGQILNARNQFSEALPFLKKAIAVRPEEPAPHYQLSLAYRRLGQQALAGAEIEKFQQLHQKTQERNYFRTGLIAYLQEGLRLSEKERQTRELQYLEHARAIKPADDVLNARLIASCLALDKKTEARKVIQEWIAKDTNGSVRLRVGEILLAHGQNEAAIQYFNQAAEHDQVRTEARLELGRAQFRSGRFETALEILDSIPPRVDLAAQHALLRAAILDKLGRYDAALASYQQAVRATPQQESTYFELGLFFVRHLAFDAAAEVFQAARKNLPASLNLALAEAISLNLAGRLEDASTKLREMQSQWPEQDSPYVLAGIAAYTAYKFDDFRREFEKALALGLANPLVPFYLATLESQSAAGNLDEALRWAQTAVAGDATSAQGQYLLGTLLKRSKRNDEARHCLEKAVSLQPSLAEAHFLLAQLYAESGDTARAEAERRESERWHREVNQISPDREAIQKLLINVVPSGQ